jgi:hypothetical protein
VILGSEEQQPLMTTIIPRPLSYQR